MAILPVAPAGTGQPPSSPKLDSKLCTPASSAASTLARPCPRVLWKCAVRLDLAAQALPGQLEELAHLQRVGHAGRIAEADLLRAGVAQQPRDLQHALRRHAALIRAAEGGRNHALAAQALRACAPENRLQPGQRLGDRAVDVLAVVRL